MNFDPLIISEPKFIYKILFRRWTWRLFREKVLILMKPRDEISKQRIRPGSIDKRTLKDYELMPRRPTKVLSQGWITSSLFHPWKKSTLSEKLQRLLSLTLISGICDYVSINSLFNKLQWKVAQQSLKALISHFIFRAHPTVSWNFVYCRHWWLFSLLKITNKSSMLWASLITNKKKLKVVGVYDVIHQTTTRFVGTCWMFICYWIKLI